MFQFKFPLLLRNYYIILCNMKRFVDKPTAINNQTMNQANKVHRNSSWRIFKSNSTIGYNETDVMMRLCACR